MNAKTLTDDYVLGTDDQELQRLGLQHKVWRSAAREGWRRAGIATGFRALDVGSGPGFASLDLAEVVGREGRVFSIERSKRFAQHLTSECDRRHIRNIEVIQADLMDDAPLPVNGIDVAWCRWVACFVESLDTLVEKIVSTLRPGGSVIFHEYIDYSTWRFAPRTHQLEAFVKVVMQSWRDHGGEPDIALELPEALTKHGMTITSTVPLVFCVTPDDDTWRWPAGFINTNLERLTQLGLVDDDWKNSVRTSKDGGIWTRITEFS